MRRFPLITYLSLVTAALICSGTGLSQDGRYLNHQSWSTEEGLPQNSAHQIMQSSDGYLWLATEGGVARFDGYAFTILRHESDPTFTSDDISNLIEDGQGIIWFATADGLIRYDHRTTSKVLNIDRNASLSISSLSLDTDGKLLVGTGSGVFRNNGKSFVKTDNAEAKASHTIGNKWNWTPRGVEGLNRLWTVGRELPGTRVESFFVDRAGDAWVGTNHGLVTISATSKAVQVIPELGSDEILCTVEDREGNLWIGTDTSGLHVLRPRKFRTDPMVRREPITALVETTDGATWYATRTEGLLRSMHNTPAVSAGLDNSVVLALEPGRRGDLWVGTADGLIHLQQGAQKRYTTADGLPDDFVQSLLLARDGSLWIGTRHGMARMQQDHIVTVTGTEKIKRDLIGVLFEANTDGSPGAKEVAQTDIWFGTLDGIARIRNGETTQYSSAEGLPKSIVSGIAQDGQGRLWVATRNGMLSLFKDGRFLTVRGVQLSNDIEAMAVDGSEHLWLQSRRGVVRVATNDLIACIATEGCKPTVGRYGTADGMPSDETPEGGSPTIWKTTDGHLLFATQKGVAVANWLHLPLNTVPPPVVVERFTVDDTVIVKGSNSPEFPSSRRRFTFDYAGLSYTLPSKVQYRYRLEGFDHEWTEAGSRRTAYYTNLPPGKYRFRVLAANNDGVWNMTGAEESFSILRPFYRRWWFFLLMAAMTAAVIYGLYQMRLRRLRSRFELVLNERNRVAREIHDTLVQDFVGVSIQLDIASRLLAATKVPQAMQQLAHTKSLVQEGLVAARQSIWDLRRNNGKEDLPERLTGVVERVFKPGNSVEVTIGGVYRPIPSSTENEILRIAQEALVNVERHAQAEAVSVDMLYTDAALELIIRDNGRGFALDGDRKSGHYGLQGMKERADALGAALTVVSAPGEGTTITLHVPLNEA